MTRNFTEIIFGPEEAHGVPEVGQKSPEATTRVGDAPYYLVGPSWLPWPTSFSYISGSRIDREFRRQKPL